MHQEGALVEELANGSQQSVCFCGVGQQISLWRWHVPARSVRPQARKFLGPRDGGAHVAQAARCSASSLAAVTFGLVMPLNELAVIEAAAGETEAAARLWGAVASALEAHELSLPPFHRSRQAAREPQVRAAMGEVTFAAASLHGRAMGLAGAVEFALART